MKNKVILFIFIILAAQSVSAQPSQAEIDKMVKQANDAMKKYGNDSSAKKAMKDVQDKQKQVADAMKNNASGKNPIATKNDTTAFSLSARNNKLLAALPVRIFNKAELVSYLHNLNLKLTEYLHNNYGTSIANISTSATEQSGTPIGLWLKGNIKESVLVTVKAAELKPDNNLVLNNTGGMLTNCGLGFYAIPILEYVLEKQPKNNIILNNLGQAYLDLGDDKKAELYLLRCIKSYKYYPDANLALAYIYHNRGQKATAISYAENSLRGAWSSKANNFLRKLKPDLKLMDYIRHRYKQPEYFNVNKYPMLEQCGSTGTVYQLKPLYVGYKQMIDKLFEKYRTLLAQAAMAAGTSVKDDIMNVTKTQRNPYRPFGAFGNSVLQSLKEEYKEKYRSLDSYIKYYARQRDSLNKEYMLERQEMQLRHQKDDFMSDESKCGERTALNNKYLPLFADMVPTLQRKTLLYLKDYLNDMAYWSYIASINDDQFHLSYYTLVVEALSWLKFINTTRFMEDPNGSWFYPCDFEETGKSNTDSVEIAYPDCWINPKIEADLGVFKLEISCETYQLEAGEGFVGKIEYSRTSGDITLAFGVGGNLPAVMYKSANIEIGGDAEAKSQFYITFDNHGTPTDLGVLWEAEIKAGLDIGGIKATIGEEENFTAGFGSGLQAKEGGLLKRGVDAMYPVQPDDKQINKNVPLYKK